MTRVTEPESGTQHSWDQNSGLQGPKPQRPTALRGSVRAERAPGRLPWDTGAGSSRPGDLALRPAVYTGQLRITRCPPPAQASGDKAAALTWGHHPPGWGAQWPLRVPSASPFFGFESSKDGTGIREVTPPPGPPLPSRFPGGHCPLSRARCGLSLAVLLPCSLCTTRNRALLTFSGGQTGVPRITASPRRGLYPWSLRPLIIQPWTLQGAGSGQGAGRGGNQLWAGRSTLDQTLWHLPKGDPLG